MLDHAISNREFKNFEIIQLFSKKLHIKAPCLFQDQERSRIIEMLLCKSDAVQSVKASPKAASIAIQFDPQLLPLEKLFDLIDTILANIGCKVKNSFQQMKSCLVNPTQPETISSFLIKGMKCESCAVALEMILHRHPEITQAHVDYHSTNLKVHGLLSSQKIAELVHAAGFDAVVLST